MELENIVANTVYLKAREGKKLYDAAEAKELLYNLRSKLI